MSAAVARHASVASRVAMAPADLAITLFETPRRHRGIRSRPGDEAALTATTAV